MPKLNIAKHSEQEFEERMNENAQHLREHAEQMSPDVLDERRQTVLANYLLSQNPNLMHEIFEDKPDEVAKQEINERLDKERRERAIKKQSKGRIVDVEDYDLGMKRQRPLESVEEQSAYIRDNVLKRDPLFNVLSTASDLNVEANPKEAVRTLAVRTEHYTDVVRKMEDKWLGPGAQFKSSLDAMLSTGTGVNFFGLSRSANSPEYDNMTAAIARISDDLPENKGRSPEQKAADIASAVEATKTYLSDKMTPRSTSSGKIRFEQSMKFLQAAMPPQEFSQYCNEVNRARGAADPKNKNHITPQMFGAMQEEPGLEDFEVGETPGEDAPDILIHRYKGMVKSQDEATVAKMQGQKAYDEDMARKMAQKQRNNERNQYRDYLKEHDPQAYKKFKSENAEINELKKQGNIQEYEKQHKDFMEKFDKRVDDWKKSKEAQKDGPEPVKKEAASRSNSVNSVNKGKPKKEEPELIL